MVLDVVEPHTLVRQTVMQCWYIRASTVVIRCLFKVMRRLVNA